MDVLNDKAGSPSPAGEGQEAPLVDQELRERLGTTWNHSRKTPLTQSAYCPAPSITGFHRAISPSSLAFSAAGVASASGEGLVPSSAKREATLLSLSATCSAPVSFSSASFGVPFGA